MNAPRLKTNLAILVGGDAAGKLVNVWVFSRLGRELGLARYGQLEFMMAAVFFAALIIDAGLAPLGARAVARGEEPANTILGRIMMLRGWCLAVALALLGCFAWAVAGREGTAETTLLLTAGLMLVPKAGLCDFVFQGRNEMATVTATTILEPLGGLAGTLAFVHGPGDLPRVPFIFAAATAMVALAQQILVRRRGVRPDLRHGLEHAGRTLREVLPLGLSTLAWAVRFFSPMIAIKLFAATPDEAGTFGAAHRLTVSMHAVVWLWFFNLLPLWSALHRTGQGLNAAVGRSLRATVGLASLMIAGGLLLAPFVMKQPWFYGTEFAASGDLLSVLVLVPAFAWVSGNFRFGLIARGRLRAELASNLAGALACVAGLFIARHGLDGRIATVIFCGAEALTLVVAWWMWRRSGPGAAPPPTEGEPAAMPR